MQRLFLQNSALQRRAVACVSPSLHKPSLSSAYAGRRLCGESAQANRSVFHLSLTALCRHASSSSDTAQSSSSNNNNNNSVSEDADSQTQKESAATLDAEKAGSVAADAAAAAAKSDAGDSSTRDVPLDPEAAAAKRKAARDAIIQEIISRDKVVFELKRQHELSMLRVEQNQARVLKDQEDRGMYYEQNSNVHTFDTISVGLYSQRSTLYHTMSAERLRNLKIFLMVFTTFASCAYFYYRYIINPEWEYVERPMKMIGSRVQAVREQRWKMLSEEERFEEMRKRDKEFLAQQEQKV